MEKRVNIHDLLSEDNNEEDDFLELSEDEIKNTLPQQSSINLADLIISFRYLGLYKELAILSMEELSKRRINGDNFQFEKYIDDNLKLLPKLDFKLPNLGDILKGYGRK